jgi:AraC-like DNA-binding protein|tara:strand:- start:15474 stop:16199 length:726 start_codon:yes stop_codon:yes gene_type:complete
MYIPLFEYEEDRIIMESSFKFGGQKYLFFPKGIEFYSLFRTTRKINSIQEVEYVAEKLRWLNPKIEYSVFVRHMKQMTDRSNGHVIRTYSDRRIDAICEDVWEKTLTKPYCRKKRKVIFNPSKMIPIEEKRKIVQQLIHPSIRFESSDIWRACSQIQGKLTMKKIGEVLGCSAPTVRRSFDNKMLLNLKLRNKDIKNESEFLKCKHAVAEIKGEGLPVTMRELKSRVSVRDYDVLKKAVSL